LKCSTVYCEANEERTLTHSYDEIQVFDGIAERTGNHVDRSGVRGRRGVCGSVTELSAKSRRLGDGFYYLASSAWPKDETSVDLNRPWSPMS
jgi:hypothetical protein